MLREFLRGDAARKSFIYLFYNTDHLNVMLNKIIDVKKPKTEKMEKGFSSVCHNSVLHTLKPQAL